MPLSSRGLGHELFKLGTRVRISLGAHCADQKAHFVGSKEYGVRRKRKSRLPHELSAEAREETSGLSCVWR